MRHVAIVNVDRQHPNSVMPRHMLLLVFATSQVYHLLLHCILGPHASMASLSSFGQHEPALMHLTNLGIKLVYDSTVMVTCSCRLIRHGISVDHGDRIVWAWY